MLQLNGSLVLKEQSGHDLHHTHHGRLDLWSGLPFLWPFDTCFLLGSFVERFLFFFAFVQAGCLQQGSQLSAGLHQFDVVRVHLWHRRVHEWGAATAQLDAQWGKLRTNESAH